MGFKEMVADDIENVFENLEEFADTHTWNGGSGKSYAITAVVDDDKLMTDYSSEFELLQKGSHLLYASATQFKEKPKAGSAVKLDGNIYTIDEIREDMGMYAIFLSRGK